MNCPKCPVGKLNSVAVRINNYYRQAVLQGEGSNLEITVDQCFVCNGIWFEAGELNKCLEEQINVLDSPKVNQALVAELDKKTSKCPQCGVELIKKAAPKDPKVTVDTCEKCQGIWLDGGEYDRLESKNLGEKKKFILELTNLFNKFRGVQD